MKLKEIFNVLDEYTPFSLSDELCALEGCYDNSGIIIPCEDEVKTILFSLDLSAKSVERAKEIGANLIITHHPAIFQPIKKIDGALLVAANNNIGVISTHLSADVAPRGVDYHMAKALGARDEVVLEKLSGGGYGRLFKTDLTLGEIAKLCEKQFSSNKIFVYGDAERKIKTVATFCGAGLDENNVKTDADLLISADIKHHLILQALDMGKAVIQVTHFACENYGFKRIYLALSQDARLKNLQLQYFDDERLL